MSKLKRIVLRRTLVYVLYHLFILFISYLLNRFFQMLIFILFFNAIQNIFNYRFHADTIYPNEPNKASWMCKLITIGVEVIYLLFCKELNVSVYSNLFVIFLISFLNALLQFYLERTLTNINLLKDESYIIIHGREVGLSQLAIKRLILKYVEGKTNQEIADMEFVELESIKQSIRRSRKKLNL